MLRRARLMTLTGPAGVGRPERQSSSVVVKRHGAGRAASRSASRARRCGGWSRFSRRLAGALGSEPVGGAEVIGIDAATSYFREPIA